MIIFLTMLFMIFIICYLLFLVSILITNSEKTSLLVLSLSLCIAFTSSIYYGSMLLDKNKLLEKN